MNGEKTFFLNSFLIKLRLVLSNEVDAPQDIESIEENSFFLARARKWSGLVWSFCLVGNAVI